MHTVQAILPDIKKFVITFDGNNNRKKNLFYPATEIKLYRHHMGEGRKLQIFAIQKCRVCMFSAAFFFDSL